MRFAFFFFFLIFLNAQEELKNQQKVLNNLVQTPKDHQEVIERFSPHNQKDREHREKIKLATAEEINTLAIKCEEKKDLKACFDIGMIFYQGRNEYGQNLQEAYYYLEQSCKAENSLGCYESGIIAAHSKEKISNAPFLLERSCNSGDLRGCRNLAILYYNGIGTPKNQYKALELLNLGCNKGDNPSCQKFYFALGRAYEKSKNLVGAKIQYQKGCSYGDDFSCKKLKNWGVQFSLKSQGQSQEQDRHKQGSFHHNSKKEQLSP